ncbi:germinal-center associated nuclear protein-like [Diadema antillarum]|uniref:germinal-center associated nuclear protein-like n=2 Tax=Diadema antillarum TaxID=105358 RepID=UPI003A852C39
MRIGQLRSGRKPEPDHFSDQAGTRKSSFTITVDDAGTGYDEEEQGVSEQSRRIFMTESPNKQFQSHSKRGVKRDLSPSKSSEISRQLIPFDDPFSSDISDLETFGQAPVKMKDPQVEHEAKQGRSVVKRGSLFSRALEDAQGATGLEMKRRRPDESQTSDTSSKIQSALSTFASSKEVKSLNTIVCKGVPEELNNRIFLARFFKKFGDVRKVTVSPIKTMATIYFQNHDSAARAKKEVKELKPGTSPVTIFWGQKEKRTDSRTSAKDENVPHPAQQKVVPAGEQKREHSPAPNSTGRSVKTFHSAAERYEALEERDKQLRKGLTKQSDLATAKTMIGTCPDMCPEKERYMREVQRRLSPYEMVPGTEKQGENPRVDHIRAVKEYSRSSADQEEPLPSELRPPYVLDMTMNYLMSKLMNQIPERQGGDGRSWADWFDFLWNRTRSIRKEITQQQLCGTVAVGLMEKCARFHIYCSYRLCEEDMMTFDPKINNENLTKCLQSLKQFYHDLASEGIFCPNESEFRAYEVLLNLTGGDILREVQQYRPEVRNSEAVIFALRVSSAFSSNNYCRFFKLIRAASFLNACILHRYFVQVRSRALETMNKAFTTAKGSTLFPTQELVQLLAFESPEQVSVFCEYHGLEESDGCIKFSRAGFVYPEELAIAQLGPLVIESKNQKLPGEVVNGGVLPHAPNHQPASSFDDEGRLLLLGRTRQAEPQKADVEDVSKKHISLETSRKGPQTQEMQPSIASMLQQEQQDLQQQGSGHAASNEVVKDITKEMFLEVIDEMVLRLAKKVREALDELQVSADVSNSIIEEKVVKMSHSIAMEALKEEQHADSKRKEQEKQEAEKALQHEREMAILREELARRLGEALMEEVMDRCLHDIAVKEIRDYEKQLTKEWIETCSAVLTEDIFKDVIGAEARSLSDSVIAMATAERDSKLSEISTAIRRNKLNCLFQKWQRVKGKRVKIRCALETFPAGPLNTDMAQQLQILWPSVQDHRPLAAPSCRSTRPTLPLSLQTPYTVITENQSTAMKILHQHYTNWLRQEKAWEPVSLATIYQDVCHPLSLPVLQSQKSACNAPGYWKLVVSLPPQPGANYVVYDWLRAKLMHGKISQQLRKQKLKDDENVQTLSLYTQVASQLPVGICTKAVIGCSLGDNAVYQLMGSSGFILTLASPANESCIQEACQRLNMVLANGAQGSPVPILCVVSDTDAAVAERWVFHLNLELLTKEKKIAAWKTVVIPLDVADPIASERLKEGLAWLVSHRVRVPSIACDSLQEYLDSGLSKFFSTNVQQLAKMRRESGQFPLAPSAIVGLFNAVISHLAMVASSDSLMKISWPPPEFDRTQHPDLPSPEWNTSETLTDLRSLIHCLQLPQWPVRYQGECDWSAVCQDCINYVALLPGHFSDKAPLLSRVRWLLAKGRRTFEAACFLTFDTEGCEPMPHHVPWADILEECVSYKMECLTQTVKGYGQVPNEQLVYFLQQELSAMDLPADWLQEMSLTLDETIQEQDRMRQSFLEAASKRQRILSFEAEERKKMKRVTEETYCLDNRSFLFPEDNDQVISHAKKKTLYLREMLVREKAESHRFEAVLSKLLDEPPQDCQALSPDSKEITLKLKLPSMIKASEETSNSTVAEESLSLSEQVDSLKERIALEKQEALLTEMRLSTLLGQ